MEVSGSQSAQRSSSESRTDTTPTSSKTPPPLSLLSDNCQAMSLPAPLEDLSPDSIDAHTFDFETIGHPNMDPNVIQQGSLDLDSLVESPESDFMSAVNEFVIEENITSPNPVSDPTSPEMMVESLYSSVINAIDSKRIQDTTMLERENSRISSLLLTVDKYRSAAEESRGSLRTVKDDFCVFRGLVLKEQREFGFSLQKFSAEVHSVVHSIRCGLQEELSELHQSKLRNLKEDHEKQILRLAEELEGNRNIVRDVQRAMLELEGLVERKEKDLAQMEGERERLLQDLRCTHHHAIQELERKLSEQSEALQDALLCKDSLASQLEGLHVEIERSQQKIRQEMQIAEKSRLQELEVRLKQEHQAHLESFNLTHKSALDALSQENQAQLKEQMASHSEERKANEAQLKDYEARITELADACCKLEVEMALKETEMEDLCLQYQESKNLQAETLKAETESLTSVLQEQVETLTHQLQKKNEEHEQGLSELRALMRLEKDHCISELVERQEKESTLLRYEFSTLKQKSQDAEKSCEERLLEVQQQQEDQLKALQQELEEQRRNFEEKEQDLRTSISDLQAENTLLSGQLERERQEAQARSEETAKTMLNDALRDLELKKDDLETRVFGGTKLLEDQLEGRQSTDK